MSRKNEAASIVATANIIGLGLSTDETLIGGRDDQTLPFIRKITKIKWKAETILSLEEILFLEDSFMVSVFSKNHNTKNLNYLNIAKDDCQENEARSFDRNS